MKATILSLSIALLVLGCSKSGGGDPSCEQLAAKVVEILQSEMGKLEGEKRTALEAQLATIRSEFISDCKKAPKVYQARGACVMKATSSADLETCDTKAPAGE